MHFTPNYRKSFHTFEEILANAQEWHKSLSEVEKKKLKEDLDHGAGHLTTTDQLKAYIYHYGKIHQSKLMKAFANIPAKVWAEGGISIIDYGCGQGIAEMVFSDFLASKFIDNDFVNDFILIEPSSVNLRQCVIYVTAFFQDAKVVSKCKEDSQLKQDEIKPQKSTVIHIFSNVVDMDNFEGENIADILSNDKSHNNVVICVSPFYQEETRGQKMYDFGKLLNGYTLHYKLEKHTDDWDEPYSCQLHIYVSSYY